MGVGEICRYVTTVVLCLSREAGPQGLDKVGPRCYFIHSL